MKIDDLNDLILHELGVEPEPFRDATPQEVIEGISKIKDDLRGERLETVVAAQVVEVVIAETEYVIKILPMSEERKWRLKIVKLLKKLKTNFEDIQNLSEITNIEAVYNLLEYLIVEFEEDVWEMFFNYASELPKEEILKAIEENPNNSEDLNDAIFEVFMVFFIPRIIGWMRRINRLQALKGFR